MFTLYVAFRSPAGSTLYEPCCDIAAAQAPRSERLPGPKACLALFLFAENSACFGIAAFAILLPEGKHLGLLGLKRGSILGRVISKVQG